MRLCCYAIDMMIKGDAIIPVVYNQCKQTLHDSSDQS